MRHIERCREALLRHALRYPQPGDALAHRAIVYHSFTSSHWDGHNIPYSIFICKQLLVAFNRNRQSYLLLTMKRLHNRKKIYMDGVDAGQKLCDNKKCS